MLKSTIQSAILCSALWKVTVTDLLQIYRATPHAVTGVSPFKLLHGRKMRTRLAVLKPSPSAHEPAQLKQRVSARQNAMKAHFDHKHRVRHYAFQKGDKVRIKKPVCKKKAHPNSSEG